MDDEEIGASIPEYQPLPVFVTLICATTLDKSSLSTQLVHNLRVGIFALVTLV